MNAITRLIALACLAAPAAAPAQPYPYKPVRFVVGFAPGGGVDVSARAVGAPLAAALGQSVVVDNKPGAAGNIAAALVSKATPDGYTLLMSNSTVSTPGLFKSLQFDIRKDLEPVALIAIGPSVLVTHPTLPVSTLKDLIALAKAKPLIYGSGGIGNITHLEMELLNAQAGIRMTHVPYKGSAPSIIGLLGGEVQLLFTSVPSALPQVKAGRMRPIGVSTLKRSNVLPDVPTIAESGIAGYDAASWYAVFAPAGTPRPVIARLGNEIVKIMNAPEMRDRFAADGFEPAGSGPAEFAAFLRKEIAKWAKAIEAAGLKPE